MFNNFKKGIKIHNHSIDRLTEAAALLSGIALYPQVFKIFTTKMAGDLAPSTFFIFIITGFIWIAYGIHRKAMPVLISATLNLIASILILGMIFIY